MLGVIDVDGKPQIRQDSSESLGGGADVTVGIPLCLVACYLILNPGGHYENSMTSTDVDLTDVNGDGYADSVSRAKGSSDIKVALNTQGRTNLLKTVTTPLGGTIGLDYHRDGNTTSHPDSQWVLDDVAVKSTRGADGIAQRDSTISYGNTAQDFVNRTDLGYDSVTVSEHYTAYDHSRRQHPDDDRQGAHRSQHKYLNGSVFESGLEYETTVFDGTTSGPVMQRTRTTWALGDLDQHAAGRRRTARSTSAAPPSSSCSRSGPRHRSRRSSRTGTQADRSSRRRRCRTRYDRLGNPVADRRRRTSRHDGRRHGRRHRLRQLRDEHVATT